MVDADNHSLPEGAYDALVTSQVEAMLRESLLEYSPENVDESALPDTLSRHVQQQLRDFLARKKSDQQIATVNDILSSIGAQEHGFTGPPRRLVSLSPKPSPGEQPKYGDAPVLPLSDVALLTNTGHEPNFGHEIRGELATADDVQLICAFIKWHGVRTLEKQLEALANRGASFKVITSTYLGSTERRAVDRLVRDFGAEARISYEIERTRLHAKAWLFHRNTQFHTAYVGSSNLTKTALLDGVEWNVRLTRAITPGLLKKFDATFQTYWNSPNFEAYDPDRDGDRLEQALREAGGGGSDRVTISLSGLEVRPYPHQREILEQLEVEREVHDRHRNLVVAATGTGKTVIAALDYRRLAGDGGKPSLLFVAHRKEILEQALRTYREVLNDPNFGELYVAGHKPDEWRHVFASIQSLNTGALAELPPDAFDIVVVDEFHHAAAASYRQLLTQLEPRELLGLTATPERTDGFDVRQFFDNHTAAEIRLWDALDAELLVPFHYFGLSDGTDLSQVSWRSGRYDPAELEELYTANTARLRIILDQLNQKVANPLEMRALGFCSGVKHAAWMAEAFNRAGIPAAVVTGATPMDEREAILARLKRREVNIVFSADVFNEGVDLPSVDTVLFLRPTESATIFLQQLGRGLRRTKDKAVLTALDFVGNHRREYKFDARLTALTGIPRGRLKEHVKDGFPELPSGSELLLDKQTQAQVLDRLKSQLGSRWADMVSTLRTMGDVSLGQFLDESGIPLSAIIKGDRSWTQLRREAGLPTATGGPHEQEVLKRVKAFAHVDDAERLRAYRRILTGNEAYSAMSTIDQIWARMVLHLIWPKLELNSYPESLEAIRRETAAIDEFLAVMMLSNSNAAGIPARLGGELAWRPIRSHAHYRREEIAVALGYTNVPGNLREGVFYSDELQTDTLLVTLKRDASVHSPTTMYENLALSPSLLQWQSQSGTATSSTVGHRYINKPANGTHTVLFLREAGTGADKGAPYLALGEAQPVAWEGERPITITWQLSRPLPQAVFAIAAVAQV